MAEPIEKTDEAFKALLQDTELLRKLVQQGVDSGPPQELDFVEFIREARARHAKGTSGQ